MLKYLDALRGRLVALKSGMTLHAVPWTGQTEDVALVDGCIADVDEAQNKVMLAEDALSTEKLNARQVEETVDLVADTISNKAIGLHTADPGSLVDYDIKVRQAAVKKPIPSLALVPVLENDVDGEGFIVSTKVDPDADRYDWQKGVAADPQDLNTIPAMAYLKSTSKTSFVDDNIATGVRYFYRVRAINRSGNGPWSPPVSRVQ